MSLGGFDAAFGGVGGPVHGEVTGEVPDLLGVGLQPVPRTNGGAVAIPVAVAVVDDPGVHRLVVGREGCPRGSAWSGCARLTGCHTTPNVQDQSPRAVTGP